MKTEAEKQKILSLALEIVKLQGNRQIILQTDLIIIYGIITQVQLAFRHPGNNGKLRELTEDFIRDLIDRVAPENDALRELLLLGFNEDFVM